MLVSLQNDSIPQRIEGEEAQNPGVSTTVNGYAAYPSRGQPTSVLDLSDDAILTDFGSARLVDAGNKDWWMPDTYRAPEVLLGLPWDHEVDLWSIGVMVRKSLPRVKIDDTILIMSRL